MNKQKKHRGLKTSKKQALISSIAILFIFPLVTGFPFLVGSVVAQNPSNYYVTVSSTTSNFLMYTPVGSDWNVSFQALWSYGGNLGQHISNATVTVQVSGSKNGALTALQLNTTSGVFSFNYSSSTAEIITFTPTKLVTQNGTEWKPTLLDSGNNIYGFHSESVVVWWDTFNVSLVDSNTDTLGNAGVTVNVTYLLLPEEGLTLPREATYSNQTFLLKNVQGANVVINGVNAQEIQPGLYFANVSIWLPTTYVHVAVSQEDWITTHTGFSFAHLSNESIWMYTILFSSMSGVAILFVFGFIFRKTRNNPLLFRRQNYPFYGGVLIAICSIISFYWGLVGIDGFLHGFDWIFFAILGILSSIVAIIGAIVSLLRKHQALAIFAPILPIFLNMAGINVFLDSYQLSSPWLILIASFVMASLSGFLICNSDKYFDAKQNPDS